MSGPRFQNRSEPEPVSVPVPYKGTIPRTGTGRRARPSLLRIPGPQYLRADRADHLPAGQMLTAQNAEENQPRTGRVQRGVQPTARSTALDAEATCGR
jgi:hypothetical protein